MNRMFVFKYKSELRNKIGTREVGSAKIVKISDKSES